MSEDNISESSTIMSISECDVGDESESRFLTQGKVDEYIRSYIVSLAKQVEDLPGLIRRISTAAQPDS